MRLLTSALVAACLLSGPLVTAARAEIDAEQVREGIDRGVEFLKSQQQGNGSWPEWIGQVGGVTALATLALLNSGVEPEDEHVAKALEYLRQLKPEKTYVVSLQTMVFAEATPDRDRLLIQRNVDWLEKVQIQNGTNKGAWSYPVGPGDNSNSQFALLALHEAERVGVKVSGRTWRLAKAYWEGCQNPDNSWGYRRDESGTGSMTCAGISAMIIVSGAVHQADARAEGDRIECCARGGADDDSIQRALEWLAANFSVSRNPGAQSQSWLLYYLYGVERVGRLTARRFIGRHDWYREGADHLLQMRGGTVSRNAWKGVGHAEDDERIATSLALLFLSKGRRPVLVAKLKHGEEDDWNAHRSDIAHLTRYVESKWRRPMTWQVVDVAAAGVDDLAQSPVLYLCGKNSPLPDGDDRQRELGRKLRDYLDRGGFLFAEGYCGGAAFDEGFRKLMKEVFPEPEYALRLLPLEHPIWRAEERVPPAHVRPLLGIEFGCRTSVVYCPVDTGGGARPSLSCLWELSHAGRDREYGESVQAKIDAGLAIGANVMAYATNRELKFKDEIPRVVERAGAGDNVRRGRLYIANLRHPGGCDAAPRALFNLLEAAERELGLRVGAEERQVALTDDALFDHHLVFMHGRNTFRLTDAERKQLKTWLERGGTLFADSICSSDAFTESFRREMAAVFPDKPLERIPADDPLLTPTYGGFDLSTVTRRDPQQAGEKGPLKALLRKVSPELEAIRLSDRYGVVFSRYDLSCALEKHDSLECQGYIPEDAAKIGLNVVLYSLQR